MLTTPRAFERGQIDFNGLFPPEIMTYESNIAYTLRFMIDTKVSHWDVPLKPGRWDELG
jgi:DNA polymerase delta subunit 1